MTQVKEFEFYGCTGCDKTYKTAGWALKHVSRIEYCGEVQTYAVTQTKSEDGKWSFNTKVTMGVA